MKAPVDRAIDAVGSLTELARRLGVEPQVVVNWRKRGIPVPQVPRVESATVDRGPDDQPLEGVQPKVLRHELRPDMPDLFPPPEAPAADDQRVAA